MNRHYDEFSRFFKALGDPSRLQLVHILLQAEGSLSVSALGDPATPVFNAPVGTATRMHVLNGASADRDGTFILHGHVWQRDPFVCPGDNYWGLPGLCDPTSVPSLALGLNPVGKYMGGEEGLGHVDGGGHLEAEALHPEGQALLDGFHDQDGGQALHGDYQYFSV